MKGLFRRAREGLLEQLMRWEFRALLSEVHHRWIGHSKTGQYPTMIVAGDFNARVG